MLFRDRYNYDSSLNNFKTNILSKITKSKHSEKWNRKAFSWNFLFKNQFPNNDNVFIHFHENFAQQRSAVDGKRINLISRKTKYFVKKTPFCKVRLDFDFCFGSINLSILFQKGLHLPILHVNYHLEFLLIIPLNQTRSFKKIFVPKNEANRWIS